MTFFLLGAKPFFIFLNKIEKECPPLHSILSILFILILCHKKVNKKNKRRLRSKGSSLVYKECHIFEVKKYYDLATPSGNDMETYMESMSKKGQLMLPEHIISI